MDDREMTIAEHLEELRRRLAVMLAAVAVAFGAGFFYARPVVDWLVARSPLGRVVVTGVTEAFYGLIKVDVVMALVASSPVILYEIAAFVFPGLTEAEKRLVRWVAVPGLLLFLGGMAFGFFVFVPVVLHVMLAFTGQRIVPLWTLNSYLSFLIVLTVPFGVVVEMPLVTGVLAALGILEPKVLARYRRWAVLVAFLIAAILAPPDALSMLLMALPIYAVYELSYLVARLMFRPALGEPEWLED
ncbi:MAG: twin-arginine translocase subunit TatC [Firmicutes bacterium]|nr:twin-arginine translocase subunit TatC [Alicyclobacillaceae bacterium]MCL6497580.1 twin-arginine translocase subunit TatC [Bacillota bacterium]